MFENKHSAEVHERVHDFRTWCMTNICVGGEWSSDMVSESILEHWDMKRKI